MNFLGVETSWNSSLVASEYFLLNGSLTVDDVSHVQEARSNYIQPCGTDAISFQCQSYSKKAAFYLSLYYSTTFFRNSRKQYSITIQCTYRICILLSVIFCYFECCLFSFHSFHSKAALLTFFLLTLQFEVLIHLLLRFFQVAASGP